MHRMIKKFLAGVFGIVVVCSITGCASSMVKDGEGTANRVYADSVPQGATAVLSDSKGNIIEEVLLPTTFILKKAGNYTLEVGKEDYVSQKTTVKRKFNHWFWGNVILGGAGFGLLA